MKKFIIVFLIIASPVQAGKWKQVNTKDQDFAELRHNERIYDREALYFSKYGKYMSRYQQRKSMERLLQLAKNLLQSQKLCMKYADLQQMIWETESIIFRLKYNLGH